MGTQGYVPIFSLHFSCVPKFKLSVVLVDEEDELLIGIVREIEGHGRAAALHELPVFRRGYWRPWDFDVLLEAAPLVVDLDPRSLAVADIDLPVIGDRHAMHGRHAFRLPLAQEFS